MGLRCGLYLIQLMVSVIFKQIKEFHETLGRKTGISLDTFKQLHQTSRNYINDTVAAAPDGAKIIVITHFPPSSWKTSDPKYSLNTYFATDILHDITRESRDKIKVWCFGHTHHSCDHISPEGIRLVANQLGYISEMLTGETGFTEDGMFFVD